METTRIHQAFERACAALEAGQTERAWQELAPLAPEIDRDPTAAGAWLDLLRMTPSRATLIDEARRILARFPEDAGLVTRACDALIRAAERVAPDEPPPEHGAAQLAAEASAACLAALDRRGGEDELRGYLLVSRGNALRLLRAFDAAHAVLEAALALHPERGAWWFNLGLLHKARHAFREGLAANQRARALLGDERAVLWNIAICATAAGEGAAAVEALRAIGHDAQLAPSGMPYVDGLPPMQVRAATVGSGLGSGSQLPDKSVGFELLWVTPISPCHGVVSSASYRDASVDYGDVVLWDAVPIGIAQHEGKSVPRFPLLAVMRRGDERRFRFVALQQQADQVAALGRDLPEGSQLFIHHERIEMLCPRCASGDHMRKHEHGKPEEHRLVYGKLVVAGSADLPAFRSALDAALRRHPGVQLVMPGLLEAIGDTPAAGKAHQMWRGLERSAAKLQ
jgi:tetratricopeptide (TPR) repeat protein